MASGGVPTPPTTTGKPPVNEDKAIQEAAAEAARNRNRAKGFRSTLLSSSMPQDSNALKTTLGS